MRIKVTDRKGSIVYVGDVDGYAKVNDLSPNEVAHLIHECATVGVGIDYREDRYREVVITRCEAWRFV